MTEKGEIFEKLQAETEGLASKSETVGGGKKNEVKQREEEV